jgi:hypothetical protein
MSADRLIAFAFAHDVADCRLASDGTLRVASKACDLLGHELTVIDYIPCTLAALKALLGY